MELAFVVEVEGVTTIGLDMHEVVHRIDKTVTISIKVINP